MIELKDIKNPIQQYETAARRISIAGHEISRNVANFVKVRGPVGTGRYACTCDNWGPRFIENSQTGCCPGCFNWAFDHHYEVRYHGPAVHVTPEFLEGNTWGIRVDAVRKLKSERKALDEHERLHRLYRPKSDIVRDVAEYVGVDVVEIKMAAGTDEKDGANVPSNPTWMGNPCFEDFTVEDR